MKKRIRVLFVLFIILSFSFLIYYNQYLEPSWSSLNVGSGTASQVMERAISGRIMIIIYIFVIVSVCVFYLIYESYRVMYAELADRMEMLDASRNDLQTTYDSVNIFFIEIDHDLVILNINNAFSESIGKRKSSIIGRRLFNILDFGETAKKLLFTEIQKAFENESSEKVEVKNGSKIYEALIFPLKASEDKTGKVVLMLNDVTKARASDRQMLQDNKMIAVGQLAAGVAHEIRNPLGIIRNYCYVLKNSEQYDKMVIDKAITSIERAVEKSSRIIDNLLDFSRISNNKRETVDLGLFIKTIISLESNILKEKNIVVQVDCVKKVWFETAPESLEIILVNLILNSIDAMPEGGRLDVSCLEEEEGLKIEVTDTGIGISEETLGNIYNPFFTTKEKRDGSGLGLYIVYNETEKLGGKIVAKSKVGEGTTFTMMFPMEKGEIDGRKKI